MIRSLRSTLNPASYHGHGKRPPFFEGWYYKLVDASEQARYAVIPGIFLSEDPTEHHAFVQVLDGRTGQVTYHRYRPEEFWAADRGFDLRIGPNRFTSEHLSLDIHSPELTASGELHFSDLTPWPVTLTSPGIMGWYAWMPFMECYHGIVSLDHWDPGRTGGERAGQSILPADVATSRRTGASPFRQRGSGSRPITLRSPARV